MTLRFIGVDPNTGQGLGGGSDLWESFGGGRRPTADAITS
jgi:hypothetical protein